MISKLHSLLCVLFLISTATLQAQVPSDAEASKLILGNWQHPPGFPPGATSTGYEFKPDGTFVSFIVLKGPQQEIKLEVEGKWKIENSILIEELTKSSHPQMVPVGLTSKDTILALTDKEIRYKSEKGNEGTLLRAPATAPTPATP